MDDGISLAGNLVVILISLLSLVPIVWIIVFIAVRMRHGSGRSLEEKSTPPQNDE